MKKVKNTQNLPPLIRSKIPSFTNNKASLYGNIATRGVIRIISRKAISPLGSIFLSTEKALSPSDHLPPEYFALCNY